MPIVELIHFGNELLIGKIVNTNASWLAKRLTLLGFHLSRITTVGDVLEEMVSVVKEALNRSPEVIITTGGLGPTFDDIALKAIAKAVNRELELNEEAIQMISERLKRIKKERGIDIPLSEERKKMAIVPKGATILRNKAGTAPGVMLSEGKTIIFAVPGVPKEMKAIFDNEITNYLQSDPNTHFYDRTITVNYVPESELAAAITSVREAYPTIYFKTHPKTTSSSSKGIIEVEIHMTILGTEEESCQLLDAEKAIIAIIEKMEGKGGAEPKITLLSEGEKLH